MNSSASGGLNPFQDHVSNLPSSQAAPTVAPSAAIAGASSSSAAKPVDSAAQKPKPKAPTPLELSPHRLPKDTRMLNLAVAKLTKLGIANVDSINQAVARSAVTDESKATINVILDTTAQYEPRTFAGYVLAVGALLRNWLTIPGAEDCTDLSSWLGKSAAAFEDMDNAVRAMLLTAVMNISNSTNALDNEMIAVVQHAVSWAVNGDGVPVSPRKLAFELAFNTLGSIKPETLMEGSDAMSDLALSLYGELLGDSDAKVTTARLEAARIGLQRLPHLREFLRDLSIDFLDIDDEAVKKLDATCQEHISALRFYMCD
ncbi:hypothetical protein FOL47_003727 [Perkinsus chesapeaki]|uniref:Uncharacterized protein n=1 Tax=Perkinsus chesapeaki TaxID=330153 RepID=A0A7J6M6N2_PERCH|nr:hypothetical protein FOL47_003727 [Perkinsus chesapeaki]